MEYDEDAHERHMEEQHDAHLKKLDGEVELAKREAPEEVIKLEASFTRAQVLDLVAEKAIERLFGRYGNESLEDKIKHRIERIVDKAARAKVDEVVNEHVGKACEQLMTEGFPTTNQWGEPSGQRKTVISIVREKLDHTDSYNRKSFWQEKAETVVSEYLKQQLEPELVRLKKSIVDALDNSVAGKIRDAVISGLGLKP